ncbi:MAG: hypothetical protein ACTSUY_08260, partial [Alphaproteobacteria bacterium]
MGQRWTSIEPCFQQRRKPVFRSQTGQAKRLWSGFGSIKAKLILGTLAVGLCVLVGAGPALALKAEVRAKQENGFGRLIITLPQTMAYQESLENGVLVI